MENDGYTKTKGNLDIFRNTLEIMLIDSCFDTLDLLFMPMLQFLNISGLSNVLKL